MRLRRFLVILGTAIGMLGTLWPADLTILVFKGGDGAPEMIPVMFNPREYSISRKADWTQQGDPRANTPVLKFERLEAAVLDMTLEFDTAAPMTDVRQFSDPISLLAEIPAGKMRPPVCQFIWGDGLRFTGVVTSVATKYTLFRADVVPLRAQISLSLSETLEDTDRHRR